MNSKENRPTSLRLKGSQVNLTNRLKYKNERKNIRNRPRSAMQNTSLNPNSLDLTKRPFSADTKSKSPSFRQFLRSFEKEDSLASLNSSPVQAVSPTVQLLGDVRNLSPHSENILMSSNISDHGSEDTFVSLGSKIKAKAQVAERNKYLQYKDMSKRRNSYTFQKNTEEVPDRNYDFKVTINDNKKKNSDMTIYNPTSDDSILKQSTEAELQNFSSNEILQPNHYTHYENSHVNEDLKPIDQTVDRIFFHNGGRCKEYSLSRAIDIYSNNCFQNKHQLSLVEEESNQDLDSLPSLPQTGLSQQCSVAFSSDAIDQPDVFLKEHDNLTTKIDNSGTFVIGSREVLAALKHDDINVISNKDKSPCSNDESIVSYNFTCTSNYKPLLDVTSSNRMTDDGNFTVAKKMLTYDPPVDFISMTTKTNKELRNNMEGEQKSIECISLNQTQELQQTDALIDSKWNMSAYNENEKSLFSSPRRAKSPIYQNGYKDHVRSPTREISNKINLGLENDKQSLNYPAYLNNNSSKVYASQVIEDYKKEIEAIDCLHELTLKDIQSERCSPTPNYIHIENKKVNAQDTKVGLPDEFDTNGHLRTLRKSKSNDKLFDERVYDTPTHELIENYFKVRETNLKLSKFPKQLPPKAIKKKPKSADIKKGLIETFENNKRCNGNLKEYNMNKGKRFSLPTSQRPQISKNVYVMKCPSSARIEGVTNDVDIDSWMSTHEGMICSESTIQDNTKSEINIDLNESPLTSKIVLDRGNTTKLESTESPLSKEINESSNKKHSARHNSTELTDNSTVLDIYSMLKEIERYGHSPVVPTSAREESKTNAELNKEDQDSVKNNFNEIFEYLEKVENSANEALTIVNQSIPQAVPKLDILLKLPQTELAQRLVTAALQLEERSCCIALLQESLANHKEQTLAKISAMEKQSNKAIAKVKQDCEVAIKRHQTFIDQLINDKKTLNHRIEQLVDERRAMEDKWKRTMQTTEERFKLELKNQHDKMAAAQQIARQRWVRQKAEKIKELTVKGLEGELRDMADRQQKEVTALRMSHAEEVGRLQSRHNTEMQQLRETLEQDCENALIKERQVASARLEKQILELELTYQEQRTRLVNEMRAENEKVAVEMEEREKKAKLELENLRAEQESQLNERAAKLAEEVEKQKEEMKLVIERQRQELAEKFENYKKEYETEQQILMKKRVNEIAFAHKQERDREIEKAIENMEQEAQRGRRELQEALRRNKEQYEIELRELAETEKATLKRYQESQTRLREAEDNCSKLEVSVSQLEARLRMADEKASQSEQKLEEVGKQAQERWLAQCEALKLEMETLKKTHEEQMHQLYAKVKVAVARKDTAILALNKENSKAQERITHLEQRLQQQRKDFLKQK